MRFTIKDVGYDRQHLHTAEAFTVEIDDGLVKAGQICAAASRLLGKRIGHAEPIQPGASTWNVYEVSQQGNGGALSKATCIQEA